VPARAAARIASRGEEVPRPVGCITGGAFVSSPGAMSRSQPDPNLARRYARSGSDGDRYAEARKRLGILIGLFVFALLLGLVFS
jgi:hypothetical protein